MIKHERSLVPGRCFSIAAYIYRDKYRYGESVGKYCDVFCRPYRPALSEAHNKLKVEPFCRLLCDVFRGVRAGRRQAQEDARAAAARDQAQEVQELTGGKVGSFFFLFLSFSRSASINILSRTGV